MPSSQKSARQREALRHFRHRAMKRSVETGDLRQAGKVGSDRLNTSDLVRQMQRCERDQTSQFLNEHIGDPFRGRVIRAAMHQPVTDGIGTRNLEPLELSGSRMQSC
jgi:recombinational DNA repair protein (RecF pathway)